MSAGQRVQTRSRKANDSTDVKAWAEDLVRNPGRYGATEGERGIVSKLLADLEDGK